MHFKALHNIQIGLYSFLSAYYSTYKKEALMPFFCVDMNTFCERYCIFSYVCFGQKCHFLAFKVEPK